jgi:hypothetical protein
MSALLAGLACSALLPRPPSAVKFHRDVLPILQNHCQSCHRGGEAAPMPLVTYAQARPWAKAIREAVISRAMPPWFADPRFGTFANDRRLPQSEIDTLAAWVDAGAPEGDPTHGPPPKEFPEGWSIGTPHEIVEMPRPFQVPAAGVVDYQYILVPTGFTEDRWIERVEVQPGNRRLVHHLVVFVRDPGSKLLAGLRPGVPVGLPPPARKPPADNSAGLFLDTPGQQVLGVYVPGGVPWQLRPGQARRIKAGSDLIFQIHYTPRGTPGSDRSRVGLVFGNRPKEEVRSLVIANPFLRIPPGASDFPVQARVTLAAPARLVSLFPHMHVRGKAFEYRAVYPDGTREVLLSVPRYDFNWQLTYYLETQRDLPAGTVLECLARYDNSAANRANPDPTAEVAWGDQTWEEMLAGFIDLAVAEGTDPRNVVGPPASRERR